MGPLLLFLTTFIWGTAFLAQKIGGESLGPVAMTCFRSILGGCFLLGVIGFRRLAHRQSTFPVKRSILAGVLCGVPLFFAITAQQIGIAYTTPGISAFLTTNYVLFVPIIAAILTRKPPSSTVIAGALAALAGTYLICLSSAPGSENSAIPHSVGPGEAWTVLCAILFSVQMIAVDRLVKRSDALVLSAAQLFTCAVLGLVCFAMPSELKLITALPASEHLVSAIWSLFYVGVLSSGVAYTLQTFGQARTPAGLAAIICSMESVFGALAGYLCRGDILSSVQFAGCALVFLAATVTQIAQISHGRFDRRA